LLIATAALCWTLVVSDVAFADTRSNQPVADTVITTKVKAELAKDKPTHATQIKVTTKDGVVTLSGTVASAAEKKQAEQHASGVKGVTVVTNVLEVKQ
jgi:hyperosmotically inducible protein